MEGPFHCECSNHAKHDGQTNGEIQVGMSIGSASGFLVNYTRVAGQLGEG